MNNSKQVGKPKGLLTRQEYANHRAEKGLVGGTYQTVSKNVRDGKISVIEGKWIDPKIADEEWSRNINPQYYPEDMRQDISETEEDELPSKGESERRIFAIKAIKEELSLMEMQGELVRVSDIYDDLFEIITTVKNALIMIPQRVSPELASLSDVTDVENLLEAEIYDVLGKLADQLSRKQYFDKDN